MPGARCQVPDILGVRCLVPDNLDTDTKCQTPKGPCAKHCECQVPWVSGVSNPRCPVPWMSGAIALYQRWKKVASAAALRVIIFHSCANFWFCHAFLKRFLPFLAFLLIFARLCASFAHILCANFSGSTFFQCYFVSFFHLCIVPDTLSSHRCDL